jgi:hypothetical protein
MQVIATLAIVVPAHLAEHPDDLVPAILRRDGPPAVRHREWRIRRGTHRRNGAGRR